MKKLSGLGLALFLCILAFGIRPAEANEVVGPFQNRSACEAAAASSTTEHSDCYRCPSGPGYCYTAYPPGCPAPRPYSGFCTYNVVFAQDPVTGACCMYGDPCSAPEGWTLYSGPGCQDYTIEG
jgi:hypothetical protein